MVKAFDSICFYQIFKFQGPIFAKSYERSNTMAVSGREFKCKLFCTYSLHRGGRFRTSSRSRFRVCASWGRDGVPSGWRRSTVPRRHVSAADPVWSCGIAESYCGLEPQSVSKLKRATTRQAVIGIPSAAISSIHTSGFTYTSANIQKAAWKIYREPDNICGRGNLQIHADTMQFYRVRFSCTGC